MYFSVHTQGLNLLSFDWYHFYEKNEKQEFTTDLCLQ